MAPSGRQENPGAKTSGSRKALKTNEFKSARTAPVVQAPTEGDMAEPVLREAADEVAAAAVAAPASEAPTDVAPAKTASGKARAATGARPAFKTSGARKAIPGEASGRSAAPRPSSGMTVWLICRECHEEYTLDPARMQGRDTLTCTTCGHISQAPTEDNLRQIELYKGIEKRTFTTGAVTFALTLATLVWWTLAVTTDPDRTQNVWAFSVPLSFVVSMFAATLVYLRQHERSRWETYF